MYARICPILAQPSCYALQNCCTSEPKVLAPAGILEPHKRCPWRVLVPISDDLLHFLEMLQIRCNRVYRALLEVDWDPNHTPSNFPLGLFGSLGEVNQRRNLIHRWAAEHHQPASNAAIFSSYAPPFTQEYIQNAVPFLSQPVTDETQGDSDYEIRTESDASEEQDDATIENMNLDQKNPEERSQERPVESIPSSASSSPSPCAPEISDRYTLSQQRA